MVPLLLWLGVGPFTLLLCALMLLVMAPLFVVPQIRLARALAPVLADAPATPERITMREQLPRIATAASGKVLAAGLIGAVAMMAGGTLQLLDAVMDGRLAQRALPVAVLLSMGALLAGYFVYLMMLKARQKRIAVA
jgi:hypothetical protein